jgi:hypothetical protein
LNWMPTDETYDLIVTHFFLDCFRPDQLGHIIPRFAACATPNANWLIADFQIPARGLQRIRGRLITMDHVCLLPCNNRVARAQTRHARCIFGVCRF